MGFIKSLKHAGNGVLEVLRTERNARLHIIAALAALTLGVFLGVEPAELAAIFFVILLVFLAEIFNTAIEKTLDLIDGKENPQIKVIKDVTAGAVLVSAVGAVIIAVVIFWPYVLALIWPGQ